MKTHDLLDLVCCPVTKAPLRIMTRQELRELNASIARGEARCADCGPVNETLDAGLAAEGGDGAYRVLDGVPILLPGLRIVKADSGTVRSAPGSPPGSSGVAKVWEVWGAKWNTILPPARPSAEDVTAFEQLVGGVCAETNESVPRAVLLGVTPEIARMRWPTGTRLLALDFSEVVIRHVWPRDVTPDGVAARADWRAMPVRDGVYDIVIGDGILLWQRYPEDFYALASEMRRVLKDDGALVVRLFAKPEKDDPIDAIFDDLRRGRIANAAAAHLRLGMALRRDLNSGTRLGDAYDVWHANVPDEAVLLPSLGWPPESLGSFDLYRGLDTRVAFLTLAEVSDVLSEGFRLTECRVPTYDERGMFPTVVFRPKP